MVLEHSFFLGISGKTINRKKDTEKSVFGQAEYSVFYE